MTQKNTNNRIVAREILWTYRVNSGENADQDFYAALEQIVADAIMHHLGSEERIWVGREMRLEVGSYVIQARLTNVEPLLATAFDDTTQFLAHYRQRNKDEGQDISAFIADIIRYPNEKQDIIFHSLVGLDEIKTDMVRKLSLLLKPDYTDYWLKKTYANNSPVLLAQVLHDRYPLLITEGEVGSGKTALARSVGSQVAAKLQTGIALYVINAQVRGGGHVGELTQNISRTFDEAERCQESEQIPVIVFIDEADALAQARGGNQTHHEDDAGVNTLIQRIDRLRGRPMAVIFATNMVYALDAAILRRAIATYHFDRPSDKQRLDIFLRLLTNTGINEQDIAQLIALTEPHSLPSFGTEIHRYTYSDISQRIIPYAVEEAVYLRKPLHISHLIKACHSVMPTPEMYAITDA